jgi:hypothetical protein
MAIRPMVKPVLSRPFPTQLEHLTLINLGMSPDYFVIGPIVNLMRYQWN